LARRRFFHLLGTQKNNQAFIEKIEEAKDEKALLQIWEEDESKILS
jgi:adenine-specific DNA-methyltransferase